MIRVATNCFTAISGNLSFCCFRVSKHSESMITI